MRVNVYSQELTNEAKLICKTADTGVLYSAVMLMLHSSEMLHHRGDDDDRSAVTFWLPRAAARREMLALTFEAMATMVRNAPAETGLD